MIGDPRKGLIKLSQVTACVPVSPRTVRAWIRSGRLKAWKVGGRLWFTSWEAVQRCMEAQTTGSTPPARIDDHAAELAELRSRHT